MSSLEELTSLSSAFGNPALEKWKADGKKVVGYFCNYVPEEIFYAAGALPYRIKPVGCTDTSLADVWLSRVNCSYIRSSLQYALEGKYEFLDAVIFTNGCDHTRRLYDVWREKVPYNNDLRYFFQVPHKVTDETTAFFKDTITDLKNEINQFFGVEIGDQRLKNAVQVCNETRGLLMKLYDLRQSKNPPITGEQCLKIVLAATTIPKDQFNQLLKKTLNELSEKKGISDYRARLMIVGSEYDDPDHVRVIEELGGLVVADTLCVGARYFWQPVENGNDMISSLAKSYITRPGCPRMANTLPDRLSFTVDMARRFKVDGVIAQRIRYCDLWGAEQYNLKKRLEEEGIPLLLLEREYALGGIGQLKTRVQAFLEMIEVMKK